MTFENALTFDWDGVILNSAWSEKPRDIGQVYLVPENTPNSQVKYLTVTVPNKDFKPSHVELNTGLNQETYVDPDSHLYSNLIKLFRLVMYRDLTEQFHVLSPQEHLIMHHKAKRIHIVVKLQQLMHQMPHQPLPPQLPWMVPREVFRLDKQLEDKWWLLILKLEWWDLLISSQAILLPRNQMWTKRWNLKVDLGKARIYFFTALICYHYFTTFIFFKLI